MAYKTEQITTSKKVASTIGAFLPVFMNPASSVDDTVVPVGSANQAPLGLTIATGASVGNAYAIAVAGEAKAIAAASLGAGAPVAVGSTNGRLIPLLPSGLSTALGSAIGAQGLRYQVGVAMRAAVDGDIFTIQIDPRQIV